MDTRTFGFRVILEGVDVMTDDIAENLFVAGCDDCSPFSSAGIAGADFDREAASLEAAVASALNDVRKAGYEATRVEIEAADFDGLQTAAN